MRRSIYLDHAASTYPYEELKEIYTESFECYANASASHEAGISEERAVLKELSSIAEDLNVNPEELFLVSGATEACNCAIKGYLTKMRRKSGKIAYTAGEHEAVKEPFLFMAKLFGFQPLELPLSADGKPDLTAAEELIDDKVLMVAAMAVNNETGAVYDIKSLKKIIKNKAPGAVLFVDFAQALCKIPINDLIATADMGAFSGHKIHAGKGSGLMYVKKSLTLTPLIHGGGQQRGMRSGTIDGFSARALSYSVKKGLSELDASYHKLEILRSAFIDELDPGIFEINSPSDAVPGILNISINKINGETLQNALSSENIFVSRSSACSSRSPLSRVLSAMKLGKDRVMSALRISFDPSQTEEEVRMAAGRINHFASILVKRS